MPQAPAPHRVLRVVVFVVGSASLGAEIAAARLLAPYYGASTIIWANTIATVLVALSAGYALGGRLGGIGPPVPPPQSPPPDSGPDCRVNTQTTRTATATTASAAMTMASGATPPLAVPCDCSCD